MHFQKSYDHSTPSREYFPHTQLEFNLGPYKQHGISQIQKPRPIIIEKLLPPAASNSRLPEMCGSIREGNHTDSMLSSEKLAFAVQLAKMDITKLKNMLNTDTIGDVEKSIPAAISATKSANKTSKRRVDIEKGKKTERGKENQRKDIDDAPPEKHVLHLYPEPKQKRERESNTKFYNNVKPKESMPVTVVAQAKEDNEIKHLRKELIKYSQALDVVVQKLNQQKFVEPTNENDERFVEQKRKKIRADEQGSRSARMLYMLQRKVEDLQNEISSKKTNVKQNKKSKYTMNLASAHRAAVKALQAFVTHAPLYYNNTGNLPPMYKNLALLIQQLTTLSSNTDLELEDETIRCIEDLIASLSKTTDKKHFDRGKKPAMVVPNSKTISTANNGNDKKKYLDKRIDWLKEKADELDMKSFMEGEGSTPDRASSMQHAIQSLGQEQVVRKQNMPLPKPALKEKKKAKSVLLPTKITNKRLKIPSRAYHPQPPGNMNYTAGTVVSKIREKPPLERKAKTPPSTPKKTVEFADDEELTPKKRDNKIIEDARSLLSPSQQYKPREEINNYSPQMVREYSNRLTPTKMNFMEKEINREKWLQTRKSKEISNLDSIEKMNTNWISKLKKELSETDNLVKHAEEQIKERLKPLLDKAEEISQDEAKREEQYKTSITRRLADIASQKAMSEGERLAEYILDDLIGEAALELQEIDSDEHAELESAFIFDQQNLETVSQRLEAFEIEEERIRRRWKSLQYTEDISGGIGKRSIELDKDYLNVSYNNGRSVMFTAPVNKRELPSVPLYVEPTLPVNQISIPGGPLKTILEHKQRYEDFLSTSIHNSWSFDPYIIVEEMSEDILDGLLADISDEMNDGCSRFVDDIYEKEFLNVKK